MSIEKLTIEALIKFDGNDPVSCHPDVIAVIQALYKRNLQLEKESMEMSNEIKRIRNRKTEDRVK